MADRPAELSIADLIRAAHHLSLVEANGSVDRARLGHVVSLIGEVGLDLALEPGVVPTPDETEQDMSGEEPVAEASSAAMLLVEAAASVSRAGVRRHTLVERLRPVKPVALGQGTAEPLDPPPTTLDRVGYVPPIEGHRVRGALSRLLRRPRTGHRLDLRRTLAAIARRRSVDRPVFEIEYSLGRGALVIADLGPGMAPFSRDVAYLVERTEQVAGRDRVHTHWCADGRPPPESLLRQAVEESRPILVISDLGTGDPLATAVAALRSWREALPRDAVVLTPRRALRRSGAVADAVAWDDLPLAGRGHASKRAPR